NLAAARLKLRLLPHLLELDRIATVASNCGRWRLLRTLKRDRMTLRTPSRTACTLSVFVVLLVATTLLAEHLSASQQSNVAKLVSEMIESTHISQKPIDDSISAKLVDEFVKQLDPQKLYFLQSDV